MKTIKDKIKKVFARTIRARIMETKAKGLSGMEVKKDILDLLDRYIKG